MLILSRREGQSLQIGDEITVRVVEIADGSVRIAIEAPRAVQILRTELIEAARVNRAAAEEQAPPAALLSLLRGQGEKEEKE